MKLAKHLIVQVVPCGLPVAAVLTGDPTLRNLTYFIAGLCALSAFCLLWDADVKGSPLPLWFVRLSYCVPIVVLAGGGWFWCASSFAMLWIAAEGAKDQVLKNTGLPFGTRHALAIAVVDYCKAIDMPTTPGNIIAALDTLDVLQRARVRDKYGPEAKP